MSLRIEVMEASSSAMAMNSLNPDPGTARTYTCMPFVFFFSFHPSASEGCASAGRRTARIATRRIAVLFMNYLASGAMVPAAAGRPLR